MSATRQLLREALGWVVVELRQRRAVDEAMRKELNGKLDTLIKLAGGADAKVTAIREDHDALVSKVQGQHERLASLERRSAR